MDMCVSYLHIYGTDRNDRLIIPHFLQILICVYLYILIGLLNIDMFIRNKEMWFKTWQQVSDLNWSDGFKDSCVSDIFCTRRVTLAQVDVKPMLAILFYFFKVFLELTTIPVLYMLPTTTRSTSITVYSSHRWSPPICSKWWRSEKTHRNCWTR